MSNINPRNEAFFTDAFILESVPEVGAKERPGLQKKQRVPFLQEYTAKFGNSGAVVFNAAKEPIASMGRCFALYVDPAYRGKGIAKNMIKEWLLANRSYQADGPSSRTEGGKASYAAGWQMYKEAIAAEESVNG